MKLHIGSGSVYLKGWVNVDLRGPKTFLASDRPDLVEKLGTTDEEYYARHADKTLETVREGPLDQEYICDVFGSFSELPIPYWEVEEVLARHCFEHLSLAEARAALDMLDSVVKVGGVLRLDVPDHEETLRQYKLTGDAFYVRHLLGPRRNEFGYHMMSYTRELLKKMVEEHGFVFVREEPNIHFYPAFCLRFVKADLLAPRDYVRPPYPIEDHWNVLEVGPGNYPFLRADVYVDWNAEKLEPLKPKRVVQANIMDGFPLFGDKEFDYCWCSHVFEHVEDPVACARTLSRIAKRGTLIMPSALKEAIFNFEEAEHKFLVLPHPSVGGPPVFVRSGEYVEKLKDREVMGSMCRLFRTGPNRLRDEQRHLRRWFRKNEANLDVVVHWENEIGLWVIA